MVDSAAYARIEGPARYLVQAHGIGALQAVVPAVPDSTRDVWGMGGILGLRRSCGPAERGFAMIDWSGGVPGVAGGTVAEVQLGTRGAEAAGVRLRLEADRVTAEAEGWRAAGSLAPLLAGFEPDDACEGPRRGAGTRFSAADARVELRDAEGAVRAQLVVTRIGVEGGAAAEVGGLLVVPSGQPGRLTPPGPPRP
jgi:hypothetical protein